MKRAGILIVCFFSVVFFSCNSKTDNDSDGENYSDQDIQDTENYDDIGNTGDTGNTGNTGDTGNTGHGYIGDSGDTGDTGNTGIEFPWQDPDTGYFWSAISSLKKWNNADSYCEKLNSGGYSDWRLPTISELRTLIVNCSGTKTNGKCKVTDSCSLETCGETNCDGCNHATDGKYSKVKDEKGLWSSSFDSYMTDYAWVVSFSNASIHLPAKINNFCARCIRRDIEEVDDADQIDDDDVDQVDDAPIDVDVKADMDAEDVDVDNDIVNDEDNL